MFLFSVLGEMSYPHRVGLGIWKANAILNDLVVQAKGTLALPVVDACLHQAGVDLRSVALPSDASGHYG